MDFIPIGFIIVIALVLLEMKFASSWSPFYFKKGVQLFSKNIGGVSSETIPHEMEGKLNSYFKGFFFSQSIVFHKIDNQTLGFREKFFEFNLFSYTPLMHGKIEIVNTETKIIGFANWCPIAFICLWYSFLLPTFRFEMDFVFLIAPAIIFGVIYLIQYRKYNLIVSHLANLRQQKEKHN